MRVVYRRGGGGSVGHGAVTAVVIGAGNRGRFTFGSYALARPERLRVVAVAEPEPARRQAMAREHALEPARVYRDWKAALDAPRLADVAIVATSDTLHVEPVLAAVGRGYHVLLEKPIAPEAGDCVRVVEAAERAGRMLQIGHVLRYTPFYARVRELVSSGALGRLLHLALEEHVAAWHMAHSFVRGRFRNRALAAPLLLAKSCHDLDLLAWFAGRPARRVASFASLSGYRPENAPAGAPERCSAACPVQAGCPHDAVRFYLGPDEQLARAWPWSDLGADPSREARRRALEAGPYGRCVFRCDNDLVDHQVVAVEFEDGVTGSFQVHGFAARESRALRLTGSEGELRGVLDEGWLELSRPGVFERERFELAASPIGHYGGDQGLLDHFTALVARDAPAEVLASGRSALEGHLLGFAAERAREQGAVVDVARFRAGLGAAA
jgi:predicted dehydrogenase